MTLINSSDIPFEKGPGSTRRSAIAVLTCSAICLLLIGTTVLPAQAALKAKAWGTNYYGQLGNDSTDDAHLPINMHNLKGIKQLSAGCYHGLALMNNGTMKSWGADDYGMLGNGSPTGDIHVPTKIDGINNVKAVSAGCAHSLALKENGTVWAWGYNVSGGLGDGNAPNNSDVPVKVKNLGDVVSITAGDDFSVALKRNGTVWTWGQNNAGQLGQGQSGGSNDLPGKVTGLKNVRKISTYASASHVLALLENGSVRTWGVNDNGQLGDGSLDDADSPVRVVTIANNIKAVAGGYYYSLVLTEQGVVWGWGQNSTGELGDGTLVDKPAPVKVERLGKVKAIAAGEHHSLALKPDGTLRAWGRNSYGGLGDGTDVTRTLPVRVKFLTNVKQIDVGYDFSYALRG